MSYEFYKIMHFVGLVMLFLGLGGRIIFLAAKVENPAGKVCSIFHGLGLLLVLVAGFGLLARLQIGFPGWVYVKIAAWIGLGALTLLPKKKPQLGSLAFVSAIILAGLAVYFVVAKPM